METWLNVTDFFSYTARLQGPFAFRFQAQADREAYLGPLLKSGLLYVNAPADPVFTVVTPADRRALSSVPVFPMYSVVQNPGLALRDWNGQLHNITDRVFRTLANGMCFVRKAPHPILMVYPSGTKELADMLSVIRAGKRALETLPPGNATLEIYPGDMLFFFDQVGPHHLVFTV